MAACTSLKGLQVRITKEDGSALASFTGLSPAGARAPSGGGLVYVSVGGTLVNTQTVENDPDIQRIAALPLGSSMRVRLLTYVRFFYDGPSGQGQADEFPFPVDVCNGCLISFTDAPNSPSPNCLENASAPTMSEAVPCQVGQDIPIDCRSCQTLPACSGAPAGADGG